MAKFADLIGKTLISVTGKVGDDRMIFQIDDGSEYAQWHSQDCCESVRIEDICGDLNDLLGSPIVMAEESTNADEDPPEVANSPTVKASWRESWTWTFYRIATVKGTVVIRWLGESNGYYSESVYFDQTKKASA